jgi:naphthalene 1,2-dioxygenase system ferredoxin subunit
MTDQTWHRVASAGDIQPDEPKKYKVAGEEIALYNVDGDIFCTSNICTHAYASMADGFQEGEEIVCPLHEGRFNIKTGEALCAPLVEDIQTFEVKIEDGDVLVKI